MTVRQRAAYNAIFTELSWHEARGCWKKYKDKKTHYLTGDGSKQKTEHSYELALIEWLQIKNGLPTATPTLHAAIPRQSYCDAPGRQVRASAIPTADETIQSLVDAFLTEQRQRYNVGEISASHLSLTELCIRQFAAFGQGKTISEPLISAYRSFLFDKVITEKRSTYTVTHQFTKVRWLCDWAWKNRRISDLPRNLDCLTIKKPTPKPQVFSREEITALWQRANSRCKLYLALALNCGYGSRDISELRHADLQDGRLTRERPKTGVESSHKLWAVTLQLIKAHKTAGSGDDRLFVNQDGLEICCDSIGQDGKLKSHDAIRTAFYRLQQSLGWKPDGFYQFRKTAASEVERIDATVTELFLAHSDKRMAKHYAQRSYLALDKVTSELENLYGLVL